MYFHNNYLSATTTGYGSIMAGIKIDREEKFKRPHQ